MLRIVTCLVYDHPKNDNVLIRNTFRNNLFFSNLSCLLTTPKTPYTLDFTIAKKCVLSAQYHISLKNQYKMSFLNWPYSDAKEWLNISNLFTIFHNYENLPQFFIPKCLHSFDLTYKVTDWTIGLVWFWSFQHYMEKAENYFYICFSWYHVCRSFFGSFRPSKSYRPPWPYHSGPPANYRSHKPLDLSFSVGFICTLWYFLSSHSSILEEKL